MSKVVLNCESVIDYLVASYRERLEDDGELIRDEFADNINKMCDVTYDADNDCIILEGNVNDVDEIMPKQISRQIAEQLEEI